MQIHSEPAYELISDAWKLGDNRPLIIAGGAKAIYEPHHFLGIGPQARIHADVAVTGEEYVLLELMQLICSNRSPHETMRSAFERVCREGLLDAIPGLAYRAPDCPPDEPVAISTGVQRLLRDLDSRSSSRRTEVTGLGMLRMRNPGSGSEGVGWLCPSSPPTDASSIATSAPFRPTTSEHCVTRAPSGWSMSSATGSKR
jgi:hypothetical protein